MKGVIRGVEVLCRELWELRVQDPGLRGQDPVVISQLLASVVAQEINRHGDYDPEVDARVRWVREVLQARRMKEAFARATQDLEATVEMLLNRESMLEGVAS